MSTRKILVVEDNEVLHRLWKYDLGESATIISAFTVQAGERRFREHSDVSAIVMDACVPGNTPTTIPLVREIRKTYHGPIIAISSDPGYRQMLVHAGCDYSCTKDALPKFLQHVLQIASAHA